MMECWKLLEALLKSPGLAAGVNRMLLPADSRPVLEGWQPWPAEGTRGWAEKARGEESP